MIDVLSNENANILEIKIVETLSKEDLKHMEPVLQGHVAEFPEPRLLLVMEEFSGWDDAGAFFKDLQLDSEFIGKFDRIAIVGDARWEEWLTKLVNPVTPNEIKFFALEELPHARNWVNVD